MENQQNIKGIRIRTVNMVMLAVSVVLFLLLFHTTIQISRDYEATVEAMDKYIKWDSAARYIRSGSDYLTDQARLYALTLNPVHVDNFFKELHSDRSRENALEFLNNNNLHQGHTSEECSLKKVLDMSNGLVFRESYAMRLIAEGSHREHGDMPHALDNIRLTAADRALAPDAKIARAREMLFDHNYQKAKLEIYSILKNFVDQHMENIQKEQKAQSQELGNVLSQQRFILIALFMLNVCTFGMIIVLIVKPLQLYLNCIKKDKMLEIVGAYEFRHLALTYNDIFTLKEHHDKMLRHKAEHDPLTGLLNRSAFDSLHDMLKMDPKPVGLILVDVDKFKEINDTYGHVMGDRVLCRVAHLLQNHFRADDFCIRQGGDEFAVILQGKVAGKQALVKEKMESINEELLHPKDDLPPVSLSVGVALSPQGFSDDLYKNADSALYQVKEHGRCGCAFYSPDK